MFAARISDLPAVTFQLLLLAVLSGTGDLRLLEAAGRGTGRSKAWRLRNEHGSCGSIRPPVG